MSRSGPPGSPAGSDAPGRIAGARYGRYVLILAAIALVAITVNTALTPPNGAQGITPGDPIPPFAAPLALGTLPGDVNIATRFNEGQAGLRPACVVRGAQILNVCQLYEHAPLVLTLFIDGGSCAAILGDMQALMPSFPEVHFAAIAIKGSSAGVRRLVRSGGLTFPVGLDRDGILAGLYKLSTCPQVSFVYPGGVVQSDALLSRPSRATLRARVSALVAASRARGWKPGRG